MGEHQMMGPVRRHAVSASRSWSSRTLLGLSCLALAACSSSDGDEPTTAVAELNGTQLYYEVAGAGDAVVLIHGFTLDASMWDAQFSAFAESHRVIRYDARGFGRSAPIDEPFSTSEDLRALLDELGVQQALVVGISMGGRYAIDFALAYPERVKAVVAADPGLSGQGLPTIAAELAPALSAAQSGDLAEAKRIWLQNSIFQVAREQPDVWSQIERMVAAYSGWHFVNGLAAGELPPDPPAAARLGTLSVPTLALMGERDIADIRVIIDKLVAEVPDVERADIAGAGHFTNLEAPQEFNRVLLDYFQRAGG
jgi:pimeloyl-ACP methyl ester carboxylesterase